MIVRPLVERDLPEAERIFRLAFGTFLGAPDPARFWSDRDYVRGRFHSDHVESIAAELEGGLVGSNFVTNWGSVGFLGPLTVRPDLWERKVGQGLLGAAIACFERWGTRHAGLFTFAQSAKHVGLYQKFGFWARALTAIMAAPVRPREWPAGCTRLSALPAEERDAALKGARDLTEAVHEGLDLAPEIGAIRAQNLGDTVLVWDKAASKPAGIALCHYGPRSEAGAGTCLVKFAAIRPGAAAEQSFERLLEACEALAGTAGMSNLLAGVNMARHEAYRHLIGRGFRTQIQGVTMHRPNEPGYSREGLYVLDDWR